MNQRNVIASFRDYDDANSAASELSRAGFGDVQIRILPPRTTYGRYQNQQIIVSAIVNSGHANAAEKIMALNGGSVDLHEDANWGGSRWDDHRGGFRAKRDDRRHGRADSWVHEIPWGTIAGATVAALTGYALLRGAQEWGGQQQDYAPGRYRANSRSFRSATERSSYPDGGQFQRQRSYQGRNSEQLADMADLAWGDHDADDTAPLYDRPADSGSLQRGAQPARSSSGTSDVRGASQVGIGSGSSITQGLGPLTPARSQAAGARSANE